MQNRELAPEERELVDKRFGPTDYLETKPKRIRKAPFADELYQPSEWSTYVHSQRLDHLDNKEADRLNREFMQSIDYRIEQFEDFLDRHNITVDIVNSDYTEFELFVFNNIDPHEEDRYEDMWCSPLWASILVDFALLVVDRKQKEQHLDIEYQVPILKRNARYDKFIRPKVGRWTYPLFGVFVSWADDVACGAYTIYRYTSLAIWVQQCLESKSPDEIIKPKRFRKDDFQDKEYPVHSVTELPEYKNSPKSRQNFSAYISTRKVAFYEFCKRHGISVDISTGDYVEFEIFAYFNIDFDKNNQTTPTPLWNSLFLDIVLIAAEHIATTDDEVRWYLIKNASLPILQHTKFKSKTFDIISEVLWYAHVVANNNGYIAQPNTQGSLRDTVLEGHRRLHKQYGRLGLDIWPSYQPHIHLHYYENKEKKDWYYYEIESC